MISAAAFLLAAPLSPDVVSTNDGIILNGKILQENEDEIQFQSSVGVFTITKENVSELIRIQSEEESFKKYKKLKEEKQKEKEKAERQKQKEKEKAERQKQKEKEKAERQKQKEKEK
ncbi:MAG: hypothetical protein OEZ34_14545, partial [Spirochaetia bacterium]|nr:hypothetical protein [Spirochaetia bacterium]